MKLKSLIVGPLETNCYLVWDEKSKEGVCIDPGGNVDDISDIINKAGFRLKYIINTHGHFDHVGGNGFLKKTTGAKLAIHEKDVILLRNAASQSAAFGLDTVSSPEPDLLLKDGDNITTGNISVVVIHTPGHTEGGISLLLQSQSSSDKEGAERSFDEKMLFTGDTLFAGSIGRTDLPGGSYENLMASIKNKILHIGDNVRLFPGHGPETTIGMEKKHNQFLIN